MKKAFYDDYNYSKYWDNRSYEHKSEVIALSNLLNHIPKINNIADIGGGFGRLAPYYCCKCENAYLVEPSKKLLNQAKKNKLQNPNLSFIHSDIEHLASKLKNKNIDTAIMIRVIHHIKESEDAIDSINKILPKKGYFIIEFANKLHGKAMIKNLVCGNLTFPLDIFPQDIGTKKQKKTIPFINYHPDTMIETLKKHNFKILETRSVSNIRLPIIKKYLPLNLLLKIEEKLQKPLAPYFFGPSVFVLAQKK